MYILYYITYTPREEKPYSSRLLLEEFPTRGGLDYLLQKIDHSGSIARTSSRNT